MKSLPTHRTGDDRPVWCYAKDQSYIESTLGDKGVFLICTIEANGPIRITTQKAVSPYSDIQVVDRPDAVHWLEHMELRPLTNVPKSDRSV